MPFFILLAGLRHVSSTCDAGSFLSSITSTCTACPNGQYQVIGTIPWERYCVVNGLAEVSVYFNSDPLLAADVGFYSSYVHVLQHRGILFNRLSSLATRSVCVLDVNTDHVPAAISPAQEQVAAQTAR